MVFSIRTSEQSHAQSSTKDTKRKVQTHRFTFSHPLFSISQRVRETSKLIEILINGLNSGLCGDYAKLPNTVSLWWHTRVDNWFWLYFGWKVVFFLSSTFATRLLKRKIKHNHEIGLDVTVLLHLMDLHTQSVGWNLKLQKPKCTYLYFSTPKKYMLLPYSYILVSEV